MADSNCRPAHYECAALPTELIEHGRVFYAGYHPFSEVAPRVQHHSAATPTDSALCPFRCFPVSFATKVGTYGYYQAQHLFAYSFIGCPLAIRTADHKWTMLTKFNVVVYGDCDVWSK